MASLGHCIKSIGIESCCVCETERLGLVPCVVRIEIDLYKSNDRMENNVYEGTKIMMMMMFSSISVSDKILISVSDNIQVHHNS